MNIDDVDWEKECSITNQKYQLLDEGIECYNAIKMQNRIMQLRTVAKLTTDNESIIKDYPLCVSGYGMDPYNEWVQIAVVQRPCHHETGRLHLRPFKGKLNE